MKRTTDTNRCDYRKNPAETGSIPPVSWVLEGTKRQSQSRLSIEEPKRHMDVMSRDRLAARKARRYVFDLCVLRDAPALSQIRATGERDRPSDFESGGGI